MNIAERIDSKHPGMVGARGPKEGLGMRRWHMVALGAILLLSALLEFWRLNQLGYANIYYAAAIKSMLLSWHNFFFVSFDPGGFVTIDKPPLGFWIQTASAKLFGFSGFSILLPEALAGVLSVALLFYLVSRIFGVVPGLLAALVLALTPISVVTDRNNTIDSLLVLTVLLGAWAVTRAVETGKLRWLLLCAVFVGLGFNIKMLEAYLVIPAFGLMYLLGSPVGWGKRIIHLVLASIILIGVSFSWIAVVDLTPASQRPYVGSSQTNSELELALGYNGLQRLLGMRSGGGGPAAGTNARNTTQAPANSGGPGGAPGANGQQNGAPGTGTAQPTQRPQNGGGRGGAFGMDSPGPLRLFNSDLGTQISWLLPLALIGFAVAAWAASRSKKLLPLNERQKSLLMWATWLLTMVAFFSVASFFHPYYMVMMAPAIAVLVGTGVVAMWGAFRRASWLGLVLPVALLVTVAVQASLLTGYGAYSSILTPIIGALCLLASVVLFVLWLIARRRPVVTDNGETIARSETRRASIVPRFAVMLGMLSLLIVPAVWSAVSVLPGVSQDTLQAGPGGGMGGGGGMAPGGTNPGRNTTRANGRNGAAFGPGGGNRDSTQTNTKLVQYLLAHQGTTKYLVATQNYAGVASIIISTGKPAMAMGGFGGGDPILTTQKLAGLVRSNVVRYFLVQSTNQNALPGGTRGTSGNAAPGAGGGGLPAMGGRNALTSWITSNCKAVPTSEWQSGTTGQASTGGFGFRDGGVQQLYSCSAK